MEPDEAMEFQEHGEPENQDGPDGIYGTDDDDYGGSLVAEDYRTRPVDHTHQGVLDESSPTKRGRWDGDVHWYADYLMDFPATHRLYAAVHSDDFNPEIQLLNAEGRVVAANDDYERMNSFILTMAQDPGPHKLRVTSHRPMEGGAYTLTWGLERIPGW